MNLEVLQNKAVELAEQLFNTDEKVLYREYIRVNLGTELEEFIEIVLKGLIASPKIVKNNGRHGGVKYANNKHQRDKLGKDDRLSIRKGVENEWEAYQKDIQKVKRDKPEKSVEDAFRQWLTENEDARKKFPKVRFRSSARSASRWENVDGYALKIESLQYHISFRPILTTFEIKAKLPDIKDFNQAKNYATFSHEVYIVFKFDGNADTLKDALLSKVKFDYHKEGIGIYFTQDGTNFEMLEKARRGYPAEDKVDEMLGKLLSPDDQMELLKLKHQYLINKVLVPAISVYEDEE